MVIVMSMHQIMWTLVFRWHRCREMNGLKVVVLASMVWACHADRETGMELQES